MPPKTRHEHVPDFAVHATNMNVDLHETFHRSTWNILEREHFSFSLGVGGRLHGAAFASLHFFLETLINHYFFSLCLDVVFLYIFFPIHARWPYTVRLNRTVLYVSCTKINVMHLSTDTICKTQRLKIVYRAASSLDYKLPTRWTENTHPNTHRHTDRLRSNAAEDKQN